ncbi:hypothetical protein AAHA92_02766 [Salvia divinorum]|uniref:Uncharacterized protein n=1 Tax=Salvia divinorum TaxID=28513 RepID=A0ABD1IEY8_SALDI
MYGRENDVSSQFGLLSKFRGGAPSFTKFAVVAVGGGQPLRNRRRPVEMREEAVGLPDCGKRAVVGFKNLLPFLASCFSCSSGCWGFLVWWTVRGRSSL